MTQEKSEEAKYEIVAASLKDDLCNYSYEITSGLGEGDKHSVTGNGIADDDLIDAFRRMNKHLACIDDIFKHSGKEIVNIDEMENNEFTALYFVTGFKIKGSSESKSVILIGTKSINCSGDHNHSSIENPVGSLPAVPKKNLLTAQWLDKHYSGPQNHQSINTPAGSILTKDKYSLTSAAFLTNHTYDNTGTSVEQPAPTLLASRRHYYIVNPSWGGNNGSVDDPCCTVVARQDKSPLYLTATEAGELAIQVYPTDSEMTVKIKEFMALYGIARITMRMLKVVELKRIMGLPDEYMLIGNQSKQKWMIGNMVHPLVPCAMAKALSRAIRMHEKKNVA